MAFLASESTYLIVDSCLVVVLFDLISAFDFPLAFRLFPLGINQNLSERKIKPDHIEYDRV